MAEWDENQWGRHGRSYEEDKAMWGGDDDGGGGSWIGPAVGAAVGGLASLGTSAYTASVNAEQSEAQRAWMEQMAQLRYQYQVKDLKAAGLNPMLAYMQSPAGAGTGSAASIGQPNVAGAMGVGATAALAAKRQKAEIKNINEDTRLKQTEGKYKGSQEALARAAYTTEVMRGASTAQQAALYGSQSLGQQITNILLRNQQLISDSETQQYFSPHLIQARKIVMPAARLIGETVRELNPMHKPPRVIGRGR